MNLGATEMLYGSINTFNSRSSGKDSTGKFSLACDLDVPMSSNKCKMYILLLCYLCVLEINVII